MSIRDRIKENVLEHIHEHEINVDDLVDDILEAIGTCDTCENKELYCSIIDMNIGVNYCSNYKRSTDE